MSRWTGQQIRRSKRLRLENRDTSGYKKDLKGFFKKIQVADALFKRHSLTGQHTFRKD